ncbi:MAG: lytic transglycosylase domain-containing protein [Verrucomicrobiota bacterium]
MLRLPFKLARWQRWLLILIAIAIPFWIFDYYYTWRENSQDAHILAGAARYGVDPALVKAVVWRESRFDPHAKGAKGEVGLMQIMKDTAADWAKTERRTMAFHTELYNPALNTQCGAWYLRKVLLRYLGTTDNCLPYALADYNAGRGNVLKWMKGAAATNSAVFIEQIGFPSTKAYVRTTMERYEYYQEKGFGKKKSP